MPADSEGNTLPADDGLAELLADLNAAGTRLTPIWRDTVVPGLLAACRTTTALGPAAADQANREWREWLGSSEAGRLAGQGPGVWDWQRLWVSIFLEATVIASERLPCPSKILAAVLHERLSRKLPSLLCGVCGAGFWHDLAGELLGMAPAHGTAGALRICFPLLGCDGGPDALLAHFEITPLSVADATAAPFLAADQVLRRTVYDDGGAGQEFAAAFSHAAAAARACVRLANERKETAGLDLLPHARVRIFAHDPGEAGHIDCRPLSGPSAGGALAVGLVALWTGQSIDTGIAISCSLAPPPGQPAAPGRFYPVSGLRDKLAACAAARDVARLVVETGQVAELQAWAERRDIHLLGRRTVSEAVDAVCGRAEELKQYLDSLMQRLDTTPWSTDLGPVPVSQIWQDMVVTRVLNPAVAPTQDLEEDDQPDPSQREPKETPWSRIAAGTGFRAALIGDTGAGKTVLLRRTALDRARETLHRLEEGEPLAALPVPVYVSLPELAENVSPDPAVTLRATLERHAPCSLSGPYIEWLVDRVKSGNGWLFLDGLDQVAAHALTEVWEFLDRVGNGTWSGSRVLSCRRPIFPLERFAQSWGGAKVYEPRPFSVEQSLSFIDRWFAASPGKAAALKAALGSIPILAQACRSPLVSSLFCLAHGGIGPPPVSRAEIYGRALRQLLGAGGVASRDVDRMLMILRPVGFKMYQASSVTNRFTHEELHAAVVRAIDDLKLSQTADTFIDQMVRQGILSDSGDTGPDGPTLSFGHRSFGEYLAADHLRHRSRAEGPDAIEAGLLRQAWDPAWWEPTLFYISASKQPERLLTLLSDPQDDDAQFHRLALALSLLPDIVAQLREYTTREARRTRTALAQLAERAILAWWRLAERGCDSAAPQLERALGAVSAVDARIEGDPWRNWIAMRILDDADPDQRERALRLLSAVDIAGKWLEDDDLTSVLIERLQAERDPSALRAARQAATVLCAAGGAELASGQRTENQARLKEALAAAEAVSDRPRPRSGSGVEGMPEKGSPEWDAARTLLWTRMTEDSRQATRAAAAVAFVDLAETAEEARLVVAALAGDLQRRRTDYDDGAAPVPALERLAGRRAPPGIAEVRALIADELIRFATETLGERPLRVPALLARSLRALARMALDTPAAERAVRSAMKDLGQRIRVEGEDAKRALIDLLGVLAAPAPRGVDAFRAPAAETLHAVARQMVGADAARAGIGLFGAADPRLREAALRALYWRLAGLAAGARPDTAEWEAAQEEAAELAGIAALLLETDPAELVRRQAAEILGKPEITQAIAPVDLLEAVPAALARAMRVDADPTVRAAAAASLGRTSLTLYRVFERRGPDGQPAFVVRSINWLTAATGPQ